MYEHVCKQCGNEYRFDSVTEMPTGMQRLEGKKPIERWRFAADGKVDLPYIRISRRGFHLV